MRTREFYIFSGLLFCLCGCYHSHDYVEPLSLPQEALNDVISKTVGDKHFSQEDCLESSWWSLFKDPQLSDFIETALGNYPSLEIAETKICLAAYQADRVRSALYPAVNFGGDVQRVKLSKTGVLPVTIPGTPMQGFTGPVGTGIPFYYTQYEAAFNYQYDFDLWGKKCNALRAALGEVEARRAEYAFARLALSVAFARVYFDLQIDYQRRDIALAIVKNREEYSTVIENRLKNHVATSITTNTARNSVASAKQVLLQIEAEIAVHENQLRAYLAADFDESIQRFPISESSLPVVPLPCDLPLHLLARRPDILAQLWLIESAGDRISIAKAGFYPDVNLLGLAGFQTLHPQKFFEWDSGYGNIELAFNLPVYTGGLLQANLGYSQVDYDLAILQYNQLLVDAVREVLDGIALLKNGYEQLDTFNQEAQLQEENYGLIEERMRHHLGNELDRLDSEYLTLIARDRVIAAHGNTLIAMLKLIKALGGGYCAEGVEV